jgi:hypothetical protein
MGITLVFAGFLLGPVTSSGYLKFPHPVNLSGYH